MIPLSLVQNKEHGSDMDSCPKGSKLPGTAVFLEKLHWYNRREYAKNGEDPDRAENLSDQD